MIIVDKRTLDNGGVYLKLKKQPKTPENRLAISPTWGLTNQTERINFN